MTPATKTKDIMIKFRSTIRGKNSKGGDRFQFYITNEETTALIQELQQTLTNPKGAKIDLHITKKTANETGREFDSSIAFVKPTSEGGFGGGPTTKKTYVEKGTSTALQEKIARVKKEMV